MRLGRPPKISDQALNEIFGDAVVRHRKGVSFSPRTLKERIINESRKETSKNEHTPATPRSIDNYMALLKSIGLKYVPRPQLRDIRRWINRSSFRNACTTYSIAVVTHDGVCELLIINIDPTTIIFGYADNTFCAAVVPIGSQIPASLVGTKPVSIPHRIKLLPLASYSGTVGPIVLLYHVHEGSIKDGSDVVKVPLVGCHPTGVVGPFRTYLWFYSKAKMVDIMKDYITTYIPIFVDETRKELKYIGYKDERAVLWVDCGQDISNFFPTDEGLEWAKEKNICVNMHAAKYTGVAQQLDQSNAFRGITVFIYLIFFFVHKTDFFF